MDFREPQMQSEPQNCAPVNTGSSLIARVRSGDQDAITELVRTHAPRLQKTALSVVRNWADAEDIVQSTLWKALAHLSDYRAEGPIETWLRGIAWNEGLCLLRKRRAEPRRQPNMDSTLDRFASDVRHYRSPEDIFSANELGDAIQYCIGRMRPKLRAPFYLSIIEEMSHQEIAERLGLSVAAVKTRIYRARQLLQRTFAQRHPVITCKSRRLRAMRTD